MHGRSGWVLMLVTCELAAVRPQQHPDGYRSTFQEYLQGALRQTQRKRPTTQPISNQQQLSPPISNQQQLSPPIRNQQLLSQPIRNQQLLSPPIRNQQLLSPPIRNQQLLSLLMANQNQLSGSTSRTRFTQQPIAARPFSVDQLFQNQFVTSELSETTPSATSQSFQGLASDPFLQTDGRSFGRRRSQTPGSSIIFPGRS